MNSNEEAYKNFIVTSEEEESEKENVAAKKPKTSQEHFNLINNFAKDYDEHSTSKEAYDSGWNSLAVKLNEIGPAIRDVMDWRRIWSLHKYNRKRKQPADKSSWRRLSCALVSEQSSSVHPFPPVVEMSQNVQECHSSQILQTMEHILAVLVESNELLKSIANK